MRNNNLGTDGNELEGNINLGNDNEGGFDQQPPTKQGPKKGAAPPQNTAQGNQPPRRVVVPPEFRNLNTLDEPVCETIKRDLAKIWYKLRVVINPITPFLSDDKKKEIRNWDLWGPFIFCLMLAVTLSSATNADDKTLLFEIVFIIVWVGAGVISINGQLLGGKISFFQSVCLLGYCLFPLNIAALINLGIGASIHILIKLAYVGLAFVWSTYSSVHFIKEMVPADRKALAMYPVFLFYLFLSWFIIL
eukprot:403353491